MSASRPKTRTRSWPEKDSSIWPFSSPVFFHWAAKSFWLRAPITPAATPESGSAMRAIRASCQDTMNIMMTMPSTVRSRADELRERLLQRLLDVVDVVRDAGEDVAALAGVEVVQRQPVELLLGVVAELCG